MTDMTVRIEGLEEAMQRLESISTPATRKKILRKIGRAVLKNSRKRTTQQKDLQGRAYKKHARYPKRKMLKHLARAKFMNLISLTEQGVKIGFKNGIKRYRAEQNQFGAVSHMTAAKAKAAVGGNDSGNKSASRRQAKALIESGFKVKRANGKGSTKPSIKWVTSNMKAGQAGAALRYLRGAKASWDVVTPARSFLGIAEHEYDELSQIAIDEMNIQLDKYDA